MKPQSYTTGQSIQALDFRNRYTLATHGYSVESGCEVTISSGDLGTGNGAVHVTSGTVFDNFTETAVAEADVDVPTANDTFPRKDVVVYDTSDGTLKTIQGTAEEAIPSTATREDTERPAPPDFDVSVDSLSTDDDPRIPLAELWIPEGADSITQNDIFDRRTDPLNATSINELGLKDFASQRRTFDVDVSGVASDDRILIGRISDGTSAEDGKFVASFYNAVSTGSTYTTQLRLNCGVRQSNHDIDHYYYGTKAANTDDNVDLVVTETDGTGTNGQNEYYLYVDPASTTDGTLVIEHADSFGEFDYTEGLTTADYNGSVVYETQGTRGTTTVEFGEAKLRRISGPITGNTDISNLLGDNLSIDGSGNLNASGGESGTTTTLYMSDYASSGGVVDTEFDQAVSDAAAGDTIVFDHGTYELTTGHTITKSLTIDATDNSELICSNTSNTNAHIHFTGSLGGSTTTTETATVGQRTIGVNDASIFSAGGRVLFMEDAYGETVDSRIQFAGIESTATGEITISNTISKELVSGANVYNVDLIDSPTIKNLSTSGGGWRHFQFSWCESPIFRNVSISEYLEVSLYSLNCWKPRYINVEATDPEGVLSGEGEPIALYRSTDGYVESPRVYDCRRGVDFAWGARSHTIVDPVLHGCLIAGISVHQGNEAGTFHIEGGEIICQSVEEDSAHNGQGISMSATADTTIDGTRIVARRNGIIASGETHATNVLIEPAAGTTVGMAGILIKADDCSFVGCRVNDPDGLFDQGAWIDASDGAIENVEIDVDMDFGSHNMVYVDGRGAAIKNVSIRGNYDLVGANSNQGFLVQSDDGNRVDNIDISINLENHPEQGVRLLSNSTNSDGVLDNINIHDSYFDCAQAAVFDDGPGVFETLRIADCSMDTGSTAISINDNVNKLFVTNNDASGSITANATNTTTTGNL